MRGPTSTPRPATAPAAHGRDSLSQRDPIGAAPAATDPVLRAAWHTALLAALAKTDGIDLSQIWERQLQARRAQYGRETASAPLHPAVSCGARSRSEAACEADLAVRARHEQKAAGLATVQERAGPAVANYETAMETWQDW